jgi:quercetin dioxygenase-like cupin family protein
LTAAPPGYQRGMDLWDPATINPEPHHPVVLHSEDGVARIVAINLPAGEELQEHQVHEHAWLHVHSGAIEASADGTSERVEAGALVHWEPAERHAVQAVDDALLVLILAPWPGPGHPILRHAG